MVFVDSNVPMYVAGREHPLRDAARRFLERARNGEVDICTSTEVLQEILYRYSALKRLDLASAVYDLFVQLCPTVFPVALADTDRAKGLLLSAQGASVRDTISSNVDALDDILMRLDAERHALADRSEVTVAATELNRLKELSEHLGETINTVLGAILSGADGRATAGAKDATSDAAASVRVAIRRINEVVRKMSRRDGTDVEGMKRG